MHDAAQRGNDVAACLEACDGLLYFYESKEKMDLYWTLLMQKQEYLLQINKYKEVEVMWVGCSKNQALSNDQRAISIVNIFNIDPYYKVQSVTVDDVFQQLSAMEISDDLKADADYKKKVEAVAFQMIKRI